MMKRTNLLLMTLLFTIVSQCAAQDQLKDAINQIPPAIDIATGTEIPSEGYCDQPYVVKLKDGTWLCTMTTGIGHEGQSGQHVVSCRSNDRGKTWSALVDIEPADGPEASWVMPYQTSYGRVYAFYTYNAKNMREVIASTAYAKKRVDTLGEYAYKFSDDGGKTWSKRRYYIPVRKTSIDKRNPYQGKVRFFWGVGKPIRHKDSMYLGFTKIERFGENFIAASESWFLRCRNIDSERDAEKLEWETLPEGDEGLRSPKFSIASEVNLTSLSDGSLFCTYRTIAGHPCHAYSRDDGKTWTEPAFMTYGPGRERVNHPRAANFVRKLNDGPYKGRYIFWFHNNKVKGWGGRNPVYLLGGVEVEGKAGNFIQWGKPIAVLYDKNPKTRISYPDFIWDNGLYVTETQKSTARVHRIPEELLTQLWDSSDTLAPLPDLETPKMTNQPPAAGRRVRQVANEYKGTHVYHALYLPTDWKPGGRYPVLVEYTGNRFAASGSSGEVKDANLGYGLSGGRGFIWVTFPCIEKSGTRNAVHWWGDRNATIEYCKRNLPRICKTFGGDPERVFICGFSRGAIAASFIGLADDEIASFWRGVVTHDHFDGDKEWNYALSNRASALERLARLKGRPLLACGLGTDFLKEHRDLADITFLKPPIKEIFDLPEGKVVHEHTDLWMHRSSEYRDRARRWLNIHAVPSKSKPQAK